jgi:hypothetical protein
MSREVTYHEEIVYRKHVDEYGTARIVRVTKLYDEAGGLVSESLHSRAISVDDDDSNEPQEVRDFVAQNRTPEALARYEASKAGRRVLDGESPLPEGRRL